MEKYGIVDIGSNTVRLEIYELDGKNLTKFFKKKENLGLASYVEDGTLTKKGIDRLIAVLKDFQKISEGVNAKDVYYFATAAIRNSKNALEILAAIEDQTSIKVDLISGEKEAELGYMAVTDKFGIDSGLNIDIGGASTEVTLFKEGIHQISKSFNQGSLSMFSKYVSELMPTKGEAKKIKEEVQYNIKDQGLTKQVRKEVTGVGGTIRLLNRIIRDYYGKDEGIFEFKYKELKKILKLLIKKDQKTLKILLQLSPDRVHTIVPGAIILKELCEYYSVEKIMVSESGVRTGYLLNKLTYNGVL